KSILKKRFECIFEGVAEPGKHTLLNSIYTELFITEGDSGEVNNEREVRQIEMATKKKHTQETPIKCNDICKPLPGQEKPFRTVLNNQMCHDVTQSMSVDELLTNLIRGNLLPSALLWITSRPAAASQIPAECVHQVMEVRGFNDEQKEEYFRKRVSDQSLASAIITHIKLSGCGVSEKGCVALASALSSYPSTLRELDLSNNSLYTPGATLLCAGLKHLNCKLERLLLSDCQVNEKGCAALASALSSNPSTLRELDLSLNHTGDSGVTELSAGLEDPNCKLEKLLLSDCGITEEGCAALTSALCSNPSTLRELDLSSNRPGDSAVTELSAGLEDPNCKLEKLLKKKCITNVSPSLSRLSRCGIAERGCAALTSALCSNPSTLRELDLSSNRPGDSAVTELSAALEDPNCKLEKLL
ncbi:NAL12 protein, partial [Amia calva]|nr:NAL12 protein [Amia calva]